MYLVVLSVFIPHSTLCTVLLVIFEDLRIFLTAVILTAHSWFYDTSDVSNIPTEASTDLNPYTVSSPNLDSLLC